MKKIFMLGIALLLIVNGYPQRIFNPQSYWTNRVRVLQEEVAKEQQELSRLNKELALMKSEGILPTKRLLGVRTTEAQVQECIAENYENQKRIMKHIKSRTEALKNAQVHYVNSVQG